MAFAAPPEGALQRSYSVATVSSPSRATGWDSPRLGRYIFNCGLRSHPAISRQRLAPGVAYQPSSINHQLLRMHAFGRELTESSNMNSWPVSVETIARNLYERGLSGQNVLISLPRSFEFIWAFLGCLRAGAVAVPLDFPGAEIAFEITDQNIQSLLQANPGPFPPQPPAEAPAATFFTSGSTGIPKGIVHSHRSIWAMADNLAYCADLTAADRFLVTEDLTNASGISHVTACLATGATVLLGNGIDDIKNLSPTVLMIMGKLNHDIVNSPSLSPADFASVRVNVTGGSKITPELIDAFKEKTGVPLRVGYGMSEILCITINKSESREKLASVGQPTKDVEVKLVDDEVCVKGPNLMLGYWREARSQAGSGQEIWPRVMRMDSIGLKVGRNS